MAIPPTADWTDSRRGFAVGQVFEAEPFYGSVILNDGTKLTGSIVTVDAFTIAVTTWDPTTSREWRWLVDSYRIVAVGQ